MHFNELSFHKNFISCTWRSIFIGQKIREVFPSFFKRITSLEDFSHLPSCSSVLLFHGRGCCTSFVGGPRNPLHLILIPNLFTGAGPLFKSPLNIYVSPFSLPHECLSKHFTFSFWKLAEYIQVLPTLFLCMELYEAALGYNFTREYYAYCSEN